MKIILKNNSIYVQNGGFFDERFINIIGSERGFALCTQSEFHDFSMTTMYELCRKISLQIRGEEYTRKDKERLFTNTYNMDKIFFNEKKGITTILWDDGTKTFSKTKEGEVFDYEIGVAMAFVKKFFKSRNDFKKIIEEAANKSKEKNKGE